LEEAEGMPAGETDELAEEVVAEEAASEDFFF